MAEEKKSIFRKESLDRISSPEEFDRYLQVTNPGIWMTLGAIVILLAGVLIWTVFGRLETKMNVAVVAGDGEVICYVPAEKASGLTSQKNGAAEMTVQIADSEYKLTTSGRAVEMVNADTDFSVKMAGGLKEGDLVYPLAVEASLTDGVYEGEILVESIAPISFILN